MVHYRMCYFFRVPVPQLQEHCKTNYPLDYYRYYGIIRKMSRYRLKKFVVSPTIRYITAGLYLVVSSAKSCCIFRKITRHRPQNILVSFGITLN